jgi:hypothetical protein
VFLVLDEGLNNSYQEPETTEYHGLANIEVTKLTQIEGFIVEGENGINPDPSHFRSKQSFINFEDKALILSCEKNAECINIYLDQILSTFKFTTPAATEESKQLGYIKSFTKTDKTYSLTIDYVEMLSGDQAIQAMINAGECDNTDSCDLPNDYYISNENAKLRTFTINPNTKVQLSILSDNQTLSLDEFSQIFTSKNDDYRKTAPYWITLENDQITHIEEQYLP